MTISGVLIPLLRSGFRQMVGGLVTEVYLDAHHVENLRNEDMDLMDGHVTQEEIDMFAQDDYYDHVAYSIAPEIYGHVDVKKSLLLALVGGVDKNASGMKIRGKTRRFVNENFIIFDVILLKKSKRCYLTL